MRRPALAMAWAVSPTRLILSPGFASVRLAKHIGDGKADVTVHNTVNAAACFGTDTPVAVLEPRVRRREAAGHRRRRKGRYALVQQRDRHGVKRPQQRLRRIHLHILLLGTRQDARQITSGCPDSEARYSKDIAMRSYMFLRTATFSLV